MACCAFICHAALGENEPTATPSVVEPYSVGGYVAQHEQASGRFIYGLNVGWRFAQGDKGAETGDLGYDDSAWTPVNFPHMGGKHYRDHGKQGVKPECVFHYRKVIDLPAELAGRRNILFFDSDLLYSIFINGKQVPPVNDPMVRGVNVASLLKPGAKNVLELITTCNPHLNFKDERYGVPGNVYLISIGNVYLMGGAGERGIYYRTKKADSKKKTATVAVRMQLVNNTYAVKKVRVQVLMTDPKAFDPVGDADAFVLPPYSKKTIEKELSLENVRFWSPEKPNLYQLGIEVWSDEGDDKPIELLDSQALRVGVRTLECVEPGKIILNGKEWAADKGAVFLGLPWDMGLMSYTDNQHWLLAAKLHKEGVKVVYFDRVLLPYPAFLDACDKLGILVIAPRVKLGENQWVDIHSYMRNRPSVWMDDHPECISETVPQECVGAELLVAPAADEADVSKAGEPVKLSIKLDTLDGMPLIANGSDEWRFMAQLLDEKGAPVPMKKDHVVSFTVEGAAEPVTPDDFSIKKSGNDAEYLWRADGSLRVAAKAGKVKVTAKTLLPTTKKEVSAVLEFDTAPTGMKMLSGVDAVGKTPSIEPPAQGSQAEKPQTPKEPEPLLPYEEPPTFGQMIRKILDWLFPWPFGCSSE